MQNIDIHIHSFSMRYQFRLRADFNVFSFIDFAHKEGFNGVNISANGPGYRDLSGTTPDHFDAVKRAVTEHGMGCELDTSDTRLENMTTLINVAQACGADHLRTYTRYPRDLPDIIERTIEDLKSCADHAHKAGVKVLLENHEDFGGPQIARILKTVDHPSIGALFDYGNSQMVGEDPLVALEAMLPYISAVHMKDHVMIHHDGQAIVQGVPMGQGRLPIMDMTQRLYNKGLRRFCFENVWGYCAPLQTPESELPDIACFAFDDLQPRVWAEDLSEEFRLNGEILAYRQGWGWFQKALSER